MPSADCLLSNTRMHSVIRIYVIILVSRMYASTVDSTSRNRSKGSYKLIAPESMSHLAKAKPIRRVRRSRSLSFAVLPFFFYVSTTANLEGRSLSKHRRRYSPAPVCLRSQATPSCFYGNRIDCRIDGAVRSTEFPFSCVDHTRLARTQCSIFRSHSRSSAIQAINKSEFL